MGQMISPKKSPFANSLGIYAPGHPSFDLPTPSFAGHPEKYCAGMANKFDARTKQRRHIFAQKHQRPLALRHRKIRACIKSERCIRTMEIRHLAHLNSELQSDRKFRLNVLHYPTSTLILKKTQKNGCRRAGVQSELSTQSRASFR